MMVLCEACFANNSLGKSSYICRLKTGIVRQVAGSSNISLIRGLSWTGLSRILYKWLSGVIASQWCVL